MSTLTQDRSARVLCPKTCSGISDEVSEDAEAGEEESTKFRLKKKRRTDGIKAPERECGCRCISFSSRLMLQITEGAQRGSGVLEGSQVREHRCDLHVCVPVKSCVET